MPKPAFQFKVYLNNAETANYRLEDDQIVIDVDDGNIVIRFVHFHDRGRFFIAAVGRRRRRFPAGDHGERETQRQHKAGQQFKSAFSFFLLLFLLSSPHNASAKIPRFQAF